MHYGRAGPDQTLSCPAAGQPQDIQARLFALAERLYTPLPTGAQDSHNCLPRLRKAGRRDPEARQGDRQAVPQFGSDHPALPGHFPGRPIVPGVVLLDHAARHGAVGAHQGVDDEAVDVRFSRDRLVVTRPSSRRTPHGTGATDRSTTREILAGRLEATDALRQGRIDVRGAFDDVLRIFQAIEILLDAAPRVPALQQLAREGTRASSREVRNPVRMGLVSDTGHPHEGYIDFVDNRVDPATGTIRGRAVFDNRQGLLTPGLFARMRLVSPQRYSAALVDDRAIGTDLGRRFVFVRERGLDAERQVHVLLNRFDQPPPGARPGRGPE